MKQRITTNQLALLGIFGALALVLSLVETVFLPDIPFLPGAKPGLSNVVTMFAGSFCGPWAAISIALLKALFALATRGATAGLLSFSGGMVSVLFLILLLPWQGKSISFLGIGVLCAAGHNCGQLLAAAALTGTPALFHYTKYLLLFSLCSGTLTGLLLGAVMPRLQKLGPLSNGFRGRRKAESISLEESEKDE